MKMGADSFFSNSVSADVDLVDVQLGHRVVYQLVVEQVGLGLEADIACGAGSVWSALRAMSTTSAAASVMGAQEHASNSRRMLLYRAQWTSEQPWSDEQARWVIRRAGTLSLCGTEAVPLLFPTAASFPTTDKTAPAWQAVRAPRITWACRTSRPIW
jgi:hypothetical protein